MLAKTRKRCLVRVFVRGAANFLLVIALLALASPRSAAAKLLRGEWKDLHANEWSIICIGASFLMVSASWMLNKMDMKRVEGLSGTWKVMPWLSDGLEDILRFQGCNEEDIQNLSKEELVHCIKVDPKSKSVHVRSLRHGRVKADVEGIIGQGFSESKGTLCQSRFTQCAGHLIQEDTNPKGYRIFVDRSVEGEYLVATIHSEFGKSKSIPCKRVFARIPDA